MRRAGGGTGEYAIVVDQEAGGVGDGGDVELLPLVASVAGSADSVSFHEHTTLSEDDEHSSQQGEFGTQDDDGVQTDEEQENAVAESGFRDPSTYTIEEKRFVAATNGIRSTYSLFLAYLVPSAVVLVLGIVIDWNEPCESPMMLWACTQVVLQVLCGIVKLLSLWYLGRFARLPEDFNVTAARSQPAFKLMNLSNSALHLAWVCWLAAGTVWTAEVIFGVSSCQAESLVRISIILWAVQAFVVVMFLLFCLLACCGAAIYVGLYYRSLVVHARHAGASTDVIERCTTTSLFSIGFADEDSCSCPICLEGYEEGEKLRILGCSELHHFHAACVDQWLKKNKTCPLCKRPIDADEAAEDMSDSEGNAGEETGLLAGSEVDENRAALESEV